MVPKQLDNEEDVIQRAKEGDHQAFTLLMQHYEKFIYNIACKYADLEPDREEVVQEAMLKVWSNIAKFQGNSKFSTWLYVVVKNDSYKNLVDRPKIPSHPYNSKSIYKDSDEDEHHDEFGEMLPSMLSEDDIDTTSPESLYATEELAKDIFKFAEELNDDLYIAWWLREVELMSYKDIAEEMDSPIGTVKSRLFNAREILNEKLKDHFGHNTSRFQLGK